MTTPTRCEQPVTPIWALDINHPITSLRITIDPPEAPGGALVFWHDSTGGHSFQIDLPSRCAFCGEAFNESGIDLIRDHVLVCDKHPMRDRLIHPTRCRHDAPVWACRICAGFRLASPVPFRWLDPDPLRPPETDDEPWDTCEDSGLPDVDRGLWLGCLLLAMVFVAGLVIGKLL